MHRILVRIGARIALRRTSKPITQDMEIMEILILCMYQCLRDPLPGGLYQ